MTVSSDQATIHKADSTEWVAPGATRWAACVEYDGRGFSGWQQQKHGERTVQEEVQKALSSVANEPIAIVCAGRTDTGVSGLGQIIHFDTPVPRPASAWLKGGNANLPMDVNLKWVSEAPDQFHARFSAQARSYRYQIYNAPVRSALMHRHTTHWRYPLDAEKMHAAAQKLLGEHNFNSFRSVHCQAHSPVRAVHAVAVERSGDLITLTITANAFLQHMVRNIVGVLIEIGQARRQSDWIDELFELQDRRAAGVTAPPEGLCFMHVDYPQHLNPY